MIKAALFDLDGVVLDTETQYSVFWGMIGKEYHPEMPDFAQRIKGQTLVQIYDKYFSDDTVFAHIADYQGVAAEQARITRRLDEFELHMKYEYIHGFEIFVNELRSKGVKCAVVTSSNQAKMNSVYEQHPELKAYFDRVLTSEDFARSKPDPDCYLKGAACFDAKPEECVGLEDSFNGLRAVRASGAFTLGLATTNSAEAIAPFADYVIGDYYGFGYEDLCRVVEQKRIEK
nr:HAD family phosphatase [Prevotella sp.]